MFFPNFRDGFFFSKFFLWNKYNLWSAKKTVSERWNFVFSNFRYFFLCRPVFFLLLFFLGCFCFCFFLWSFWAQKSYMLDFYNSIKSYLAFFVKIFRISQWDVGFFFSRHFFFGTNTTFRQIKTRFPAFLFSRILELFFFWLFFLGCFFWVKSFVFFFFMNVFGPKNLTSF